MKKNAIMIAGILLAAGASQAQEESSERYKSSSPSQYDTGSSLNSSETVERDAHQSVVPPTSTESSLPSEASGSAVVSEQSSSRSFQADIGADDESESSLDDDDISADSSVRGGSLDARGYHQDQNNDEIERAPDPINPGKQADSSIRGGSIYSREREWNHDLEPSSARMQHQRMKADSSIRGGSLEARGGREMMRERDASDSSAESRIQSRDYQIYDYSDHDLQRGDFGQGSSATWESDKAHGSLQGSANWNASDDLLRDGMDVESQSTLEYEHNNDASVGGAVRSETGSATLDDVELDYHSSGSPGARESGSDSSVSAPEYDLNSSDQLEENISGDFEIQSQSESDRRDFPSSSELELSTSDPNSLDTSDSSVSSTTSTDIVHDESDLSGETSLSADIEQEGREAVGAAAASESGSSSSSDESQTDDSSASDSSDYKSSFQSNDPALSTSDPLLLESDRGFLYRDNRARGVGSLGTGEFGSAIASGSSQPGQAEMSDEELARELKGRLTRESTGTHGLSQSDVARNIRVSAKDGEVTLTGTVPSEKHKERVEIHAAEMAGVKRVNNQLSVTPEADATTRNLSRGHDLEDQTSDLQD